MKFLKRPLEIQTILNHIIWAPLGTAPVHLGTITIK